MNLIKSVLLVSSACFSVSAMASHLTCKAEIKVSEGVSYVYEMKSPVEVSNQGSALKLDATGMLFSVSEVSSESTKVFLENAKPQFLTSTKDAGDVYKVSQSVYGLSFSYIDPGADSEFAPYLVVNHKLSSNGKSFSGKGTPCTFSTEE
jgi:hypothetical protein